MSTDTKNLKKHGLKWYAGVELPTAYIQLAGTQKMLLWKLGCCHRQGAI